MRAAKWQIMDALASQIRAELETVTDVQIQVEPGYVVNPTPPTIDVYPAPVSRNPETAGFGHFDGAYRFTVRARVPSADHDAGQLLLVALGDDEDELSLLRAIESDQTLDGCATSLDVLEETGFQLYPDGAAPPNEWLGYEMIVVVIPAES